jgi:zinc protease
VVGHLGITRRDRDFDAITVLDHILGSGPGFTDRLSAVLRDELGLAYSVNGGMTDTAESEPGVFRVYLGTSPDHARQAELSVIEQIRFMHKGEFSDAEVEQAKQYLQGAWLFDYQGLAQRADRLVELECFGLSLDEPLRWPKRLESITPEDVRRAAAKHLHPDALVRVIYGPRAKQKVIV